MLVFETFFQSLKSSAFTVKVKLHNQELVPQRTETWHLPVLCWVSQGISQSCSVALQIRALQSCYCRIKNYSDKSPSALVSVHIFIKCSVAAAQWLLFCPLLHTAVGVFHLCNLSSEQFLLTLNLRKKALNFRFIFFHHDLVECSVIDGDGDYLQ